MLIRYNKDNIFTVHFKGVEDALTTIRLMPGVNRVDETDWEFAEAHPAVKYLIEEGHIEALNAKGPSDLKDAKAIALVSKTVSEDLLQEWLASEKRPKVKKAIEEQLDKINPEKKDPKGDEP